MKGKYKKILGCFSLIVVMIIVMFATYHKNYEINISPLALASENETSDFMYLSDIAYLSGKTAWSTIVYDKTNANQLISMKVDGTNVTFKKGIWAHANSTIVYEVGNYNFDYFTAYVGLNETSTRGNGVKFSIYTSNDNKNWELVDCGLPTVTRPGSNATFVKVPIKNVKYLKLEASDNGLNASDHSVYGDAKIIKEGYSENVTKTVEEYDKLIKNKIDSNNGIVNEEIELLLLQRELVSRISNYQLKSLFEDGKEYKDTFEWLFNDLEMLRLYILGGTPDGNYAGSFKVLTELYNKYKDDLTTDAKALNGDKLDFVYKKMMISLALSHSREVSFWVKSNPPVGGTAPDSNPNVSIATNRYAIFKELLSLNKLDANFTRLEVEEMRYIMNSQINDDEIMWLRDYAKSKNDHYSAYKYINYKNVNTALYRSDKYYEDGISNYQEQYNLIGYGVKNIKYYPRLWMIMDVGGVCWQLSNVGQNVLTSMGVSSTLIGQPGHTAYLALKTNNNGKGYWEIWNNVGGWERANLAAYSGTRGYFGIRLLNGWGNGSYASANPVSYILLGEAAMNDYENYVLAEEKVMLAKSYSNDVNKQEKLYTEALEIQPFNLDAWVGLINISINDENKSDADLFALAVKVAEALKFYPLPMHDMLRLLNNKITTPAYMASMVYLENRTLKRASIATNNDSIQADVVKIMANYLLGTLDTKIADFSFDGDNAGKIILNSRYASAHSTWEYSLDNGRNWTIVDEQSVKLTKEEINSINANDDIKVHIIGVSLTEENIYTIDITEGIIPVNLYNNDLENRVISANDHMEWQLDGTDSWTSFIDKLPDLSGDKLVYVRNCATGTKMASGALEYRFTIDPVEDPTDEVLSKKYTYIPISNLTVDYDNASPSTELYETTGQKRDGRAINAIDGNINTYWHTAIDGSDTENYIIIKLNNPEYVSRLEYIRKKDYKYGALKVGEISVSMDAKDWIDVNATWSPLNENGELANDYTIKKATFGDSVLARYVKLHFKDKYDVFASVGIINLYKDVNKVTAPTAEIEFDVTSPTNGNVVAKLINSSEHIKITNNGGSDTYTFTKNGTFTFKFQNDEGVKGSVSAVVNWIDKDKPVAIVNYSTQKDINEDVVATITFNEVVEILNDDINLVEVDGKNTYTFTEDGGFYLNFRDLAGNLNSVEVAVSWIDKLYPTATFTYDIVADTFDNVTATIVPNEKIKILNNDGKDTYTFTKNGSFTFEFEDMAGNYGTATANVNWIKEKVNARIIYDIENPTNKSVVATVVADRGIKILNNDGKNTYTFTENGIYDFEYLDEYGEVIVISAKVDWIDKDKPMASIIYEKNKDNTVTATLVASEDITVTNNNGSNVYLFTKNGTFIFEFVDKAGNIENIVAKVDNIFLKDNNEVDISDKNNLTNNKTPNKEINTTNNNNSTNDNNKPNDGISNHDKDGKPGEPSKDQKTSLVNENDSIKKYLIITVGLIGMITLIAKFKTKSDK